jgi:hypothetical protein
MRRCTLIVLLLACLFTVTCSKKYTRLSLQIGKQPVGGSNVTKITIIIVARIEDGDIPIQATVQWWWKDENGQNEQVYWQDTWTFRNDEWEELTTGVTAPAGSVLIGYFWFRISWTDEDGTDNEVFSDEAYCYQ